MDAQKFIDAVNAEPEYPDPCPDLRALIKQAVSKGDEEWVLHMVRQAVRQTKQSIIQRLSAG